MKRDNIERIIQSLTEIGCSQTPMTDPRLFSRYEVSYSSSGNTRSPSAGGKFSSNIGRVLFIPRGLFQHVFTPGTVVNLVCFRLFGLLKGCVGLRGTLQPISSKRLGPNAIAVNFDQPRLRFGPAVFQFGPKSRVQLATTYLDDRVRLAVGGRGGLFVFTKGGAAETDMADEWNYLFRTQPSSWLFVPGTILAVLALTLFTPIWVRISSLAVVVSLWTVLNRGGTDESDIDMSILP